MLDIKVKKGADGNFVAVSEYGEKRVVTKLELNQAIKLGRVRVVERFKSDIKTISVDKL